MVDDEVMEVLLEIRDALAEQLAAMREVAGHLERQADAAAGFSQMLRTDVEEGAYGVERERDERGVTWTR